ncbi:zinc-dependent metalloprotease [Nocardioides sp. Y6]|uniref:Zinc-dependent metalloprotease n=2 Tax=Nocardioides malaquae TaxID=2773426 RepID=A0ABR9RV77_9ACTN|nr:zinc-dependent metalloprotease [Nocardioides malaquae]
MVDWEFAATVGARTAPAPPQVAAHEAEATVRELREGARRSTDLVRDFTGLEAGGGPEAPVLVVDRPGWIRANTESFASLMDPLVEKLTQKRGAPRPGSVTHAVGSRVTGAEVGGLLSFLSSKVLGQFDPFHGEAGRLLLVAPNLVHLERELEVDPTDFRLWVCLHEETHRVQFTAVPWMREHLRGLVGEASGSVDPQIVLGDLVKRVAQVARGEAKDNSLVELLSSPEQRELLDRVTGVMSLLEGHADVVMDGVGPSVIPSVRQIRRKFTTRRAGLGTVDRMVRRLLGLDAKMAQYRDGAVFVREVVDTVGMEGFNAVWSGPEALPSRAEIHDPATWVARVHG